MCETAMCSQHVNSTTTTIDNNNNNNNKLSCEISIVQQIYASLVLVWFVLFKGNNTAGVFVGVVVVFVIVVVVFVVVCVSAIAEQRPLLHHGAASLTASTDRQECAQGQAEVDESKAELGTYLQMLLLWLLLWLLWLMSLMSLF